MIFFFDNPHQCLPTAEFLVSCVDERDGVDIEAQIETTFNELDGDNSGGISTQELIKGMKEFGMNPTEDELGRIVNYIDVDGDGHITLEEFMKVVMQCFEVNKFNQIKHHDLAFTLSLFEQQKDIGSVELMDLDEFFSMLRLGTEHSEKFIEQDLRKVQRDMKKMRNDFEVNDKRTKPGKVCRHGNPGARTYTQMLPVIRSGTVLRMLDPPEDR